LQQEPFERATWSWFVEHLSEHEILLRKVRRVIAWQRTRYQDVAIVELEGIGKTLIIDGKTQSAAVDEKVYHEALVHPALVAHGSPRKVLVLGGGEGATLREVLKYKTVSEAVMVDIDEGVVELSRRYLPEWHRGSFDDPRARLVFEDGRKFVEEAVKRGESFDAVIVDLVDPLAGGPALKLYTVEFYKLLAELVGSEGVIVTQATSPAFYLEVFCTVASTISHAFKVVRPYWAYVRSFGGAWGFVFASQQKDAASLSPSEVDARVEKLIEGGSSALEFYDGQAHVAMFALSKGLRKELSKPRRPSTDESPVYSAV